MTNEEAIKWFEAFQNNLISDFDMDDERFSDALKASKVAIKAIEKQVPEKLVWKDFGFRAIQCCPFCGSPNTDKYCQQCGQKVKVVIPV